MKITSPHATGLSLILRWFSCALWVGTTSRSSIVCQRARDNSWATLAEAPLYEPQNGFAGFSLIEVMVAILILGIALVGLTHGVTAALESSKESGLQTTAVLMASGLIETLRAEGGLQNGEAEGDGGPGLEKYHWRETVAGTGTDGLHDVDVVIEDAHNGQDIYELKTMLFEPSSDSQGSNNQSNRRSHNAE